MALDDPSPSDLVVRTSDNRLSANTFATYEEFEAIIKFRPDVGIWNVANEGQQVRAMAQAYEDISRLTWTPYGGRSQNKDYEFRYKFDITDEPPLDDEEFRVLVKKAQAIQTLYILGGTQVRDMSRDGIRLSRQLTGAEMEFSGLQHTVCVEARQVIAPYLELSPRIRRM